MEFTHFNDKGRAYMVEVGEKEITKRVAKAEGIILLSDKILSMIKEGKMKKGDVLSVAQVAGIMAAKKTSEIIPMCHNIFLTGVDIDFEILHNGVKVMAVVKTEGKTGVEMEALTAVTTSLLTIYDMCKAVDKEMEIVDVKLLEKKGGKSGEYMRKSKGKVISVNISQEKGVVKHPLEEGTFLEDFGLEGDAHAGNWHRQVSLLALESFQKMKELGVEGLVPGIFAENITTEGIELFTLPVGTRLKIGETIQEVTQIGKECHSGCEIAKKVGKCVMPKEGIFTKIIVPGKIKEGDSIEVI
ncbi:cyclic pyranopterin monophosphate synthase accessory protein [Tissierella creatinophila DSM 6911]|uniref:Cyclic pyranopterin monophosphate synthase n=2 Tax=Tissierella creatinophila TaxID=79681 RepID=A0A1U7M8U8_TISCR|nr:cyclic pyranopterin monophosphate synthase accessory protein [Tissierella creatinophila DSM 6911]